VSREGHVGRTTHADASDHSPRTRRMSSARSWSTRWSTARTRSRATST
jgi:hypothetical protein